MLVNEGPLSNGCHSFLPWIPESPTPRYQDVMTKDSGKEEPLIEH